MKLIALYVRVSSQQQSEKYSLATQIQRGMEFSTSQGEEFSIYQDIVSGKNIEDRARFEDLLADIRKSIVTKVWVVEQSRLGRNLEDALLVKRIFSQYNIKLYVDGVLSEFVTPEDSLKYNITSAVSEYERSQIIARSVRGKTEWQDTGNMAFPSVYGYDYTYGEKGKKTWFLVEKEVAVIRDIFHLYVEERMPLNRIKIMLNDRGHRTKRGSQFLTSQIRAILKQSVYVGLIRNTEGELIKSNVYTPFLDRQLWDLAQLELGRARKTSNHFERRPPAYELSGVIQCSKCGAAFFYNSSTVQTKTRGIRTWDRYYHTKQTTANKQCTQYPKIVVRRNVEQQLRNLVSDVFFENDEMLSRWYSYNTTEREREISSLELEVESLKGLLNLKNKQKENLVNAIAEGTLSRGDIKGKMADLNKEILSCETRIGEKSTLILMKQTEAGQEYQLAIGKLFLDFESLGPTDRRKLYKTIFPKITIDGKTITVTFFDGTTQNLIVDNSRKPSAQTANILDYASSLPTPKAVPQVVNH